MEWVETTGRTIEEALDAALDQLGVDEDDAEFEVIEEPRTGLFGRVRSEARIRARVRPTKPRAKEDRRDRRRRSSRSGGGDSNGRSEARDTGETDVTDGDTDTDDRGELEVPLQEQGDVAVAFLSGLVEQLRLEATTTVHLLDEETVEVRIDGEELGLLIGPKGATLSAIQDLARTVVQRRTGARRGRLLVDVSGYRERRKEALVRFTHKVAQDVLTTGRRVVLEPMPPSDRKVIHDTANEIDGVKTTSEGEEPRRRVVLLPDRDE